MLLTLLADWATILDSIEAYNGLKSVLKLNEDKLNLQIWFPKSESEGCLLDYGYSRNSGKVKHSIVLYDSIEDYAKEISEEVELFSIEKDFEITKTGYEHIYSISSLYHRELPLPFFWRRLLQPKKVCLLNLNSIKKRLSFFSPRR